MAVTGGFLFLFVVAHMLGNLQVFLGQEALNEYAHKLQAMTHLLWFARVFLLTNLVLHVFVALKLTAESHGARPQPYAKKDFVQASYASRTMLMSGIIILLFTVYHLLHFTLGVTNPALYDVVDAKGRHDVYTMVVTSFQNPWVSGIYVAAMAALCLHLSHGVSSIFQTLGISRSPFNARLTKWSNLIAIVIFVGNTSMPVCALLHVLKLPGAPHGS